MKLPALHVLAVLAAAVLVPASALAQYDEPDPKPDSSYADEHPELYRGFYTGIGLGIANPRGNFYDNRWDPGPGMLLSMGYRPIPQIGFEGIFLGAQSEIDIQGAGTATITELGAGIRVFPLGATAIQPNVALSYSPLANAEGEDFELEGKSTAISAGARMQVGRTFWLGGDFRHTFIRYEKGTIDFGGVSISGRLARQEHGDIVSFTIGGGGRF